LDKLNTLDSRPVWIVDIYLSVKEKPLIDKPMKFSSPTIQENKKTSGHDVVAAAAAAAK
jgi:hypothetical protein